MIVIRKKRIQFILTCILIVVFAFSFKIGSSERNTLETTATPVSGKTIIIDAGHGIPEKRSCLLTPIK